MYSGVYLTVNTDQASYAELDQVTVTIYAQKNGAPAPKERIRIAVFRPTGKRTFISTLHTDVYGIAIVVFRLGSKDGSGSYSVEAHSSDGSMGLSSFLVI